ncbi:BglG family transcription antiterminator LicT [Clostridium chrysemydis]|uniref:BglG family transcription antiterminator LicT n=1 Tax=Clostridium chrysemydis TaxID=2665504 RepID=UPI001883EE40|nr:PRD domain-containing protein [Clostridium chrysemydis]
MRIKKSFNNNVVLVTDSEGNEKVVMGKGLSFKKSVGDVIDEKLVEKEFIFKGGDVSERFKLLLDDVPEELISLSYDIVEYIKNSINLKLNDYIYITLTDHINNAIKLYKEGMEINNPLKWEIKKLYPKEFKAGIKAIEYIEDEFDIDLSEDEACNIAMHIINAEVNGFGDSLEDVSSMSKKIGDILNIVKYTYGINLDEGSISYERFITHLKFFFKRLETKGTSNSDNEEFLLSQVKEKYQNAYNCMLKIQKYLDTDLNSEEMLYLTLHIQRITK